MAEEEQERTVHVMPVIEWVEAVDHVILLCLHYANERLLLRNGLEREGIKHMDIKTIFTNDWKDGVNTRLHLSTKHWTDHRDLRTMTQ